MPGDHVGRGVAARLGRHLAGRGEEPGGVAGGVGLAGYGIGGVPHHGDLDGLAALFTADVTYDVSALGGGVLIGLAGIRDAALALGDANPVAHLVTNIVLREIPDGGVHALSKGLGIMADGSAGSVTYEDTVRRTAAGWRIAHRVVRPRRTPLRF